MDKAAALEAMYKRWILEVWGKGDLEASAELVADSFVDHDAPEDLPPGRTGHDIAVKMIRTAFPDAKFKLDVVVANPPIVSGHWTMTGKQTGPLQFLDLPPTGKQVTMTGMEVFRVEDGKFVEGWHAEDVAGMLRQLGSPAR